MRPIHAENKWINKCPCCATKYRKSGNPSNRRAGKKRSRQNARTMIKKGLDQ